MKTVTNKIGMKFVWIPSGAYQMGSPVYEPGRHNTERLHEVRITKGFFIQVTEVTQKQWSYVMAHNPSDHNGDDLPVEQVSWQDVQIFIQKFNAKDKIARYRLPTETE